MLRLETSKNLQRQACLNKFLKLAEPMLKDGSKRQLKNKMTIEKVEGTDRELVSHFEGVGRLICGLGPWLSVEAENEEELNLQLEVGRLARELIAGQVDSNSPDYARFNKMDYNQLLVDLAFMAQGMIRGKKELIDKLSPEVKNQIIKVFKDSRIIIPYQNNWLLFSAEIEICLKQLGEDADIMRIDYAVNSHLNWYKGDSVYGDGEYFSQDYYNSYVIQPMLLDCVEAIPQRYSKELRETLIKRSKRYTEILERMIASDGTFIAIGRSITYRCGAFHLLSQMAWQKRLSENLVEAQVREALLAVIEKTLDEKSFREDGYLNLGLCCSQINLVESYISTGSLYLCSTAFLILGLPWNDSFWTSPYKSWTQKAIWSGENVMKDEKII